VAIHREWHEAYIAVGSNMGDSREHIAKALSQLEKHKDIQVTKVSGLLETLPYGGVEQDNFVNGMFEIRTLLTPEELLRELHKIEASEGRERKIHWGPRTLDLDIIFYDDLIYSSEDLVIPHVDMENRYFVLKPLSELTPNFRHPITHKTVAQMLAELPVDLTEGSEA
jgi:dihydroneopterin aldolase/2-amino-4-hydroxy-6-hydroxymethyldihydropteridine diphosphokinase